MSKSLLVTILILTPFNAFSLIVVRPKFKGIIQLKIVRAIPESIETYSLTNHNGREMTLVCAQNNAYENNKLPLLNTEISIMKLLGNLL